MKLKIFTTVFLSLLFVITTLGQKSEISLSFTGIAIGQNAQLDSINIRNLDKNCDTILYYPDTVLSLYALGINDVHSLSKELQVFQNVPNPARENTKIVIYLPQIGNVSIIVSLLSGKQVASYSQELKRGYHSFLFTPGGSETYLFTVNFKSVMKSIKMVFSMSRPSSGCSLVYNATEDEPATLKSDGMYDKFIFSVGDSLEFKGYYNNLISTIKDAPTTNKSYTFYYSIMNIPCPGMPTITDSRDGQVYPTVQIGSQCWLQKNMNYQTADSWCYDDDALNCSTYGRLYGWQTALGICPSGWHLASDAEWTVLTDFLGGESVAGGKMKEAGTTHWASPNTGATNSSGFTALPGGYRYNGNYYAHLTDIAPFWSPSGSSPDDHYRELYYKDEKVSKYGNSLNTFYQSARCVKN